MPNTTDDNYVEPRIREFSTFQEAEDNFSKYGDLFPDLNEGSNPLTKKNYFKRAFVVADPGYGKTRLLHEISNEVKSQGKISVVVDLKKFAESKYPSLDEYLKNIFPSLAQVNLGDWSSQDALLCFDALDEIRDTKFSSTVDELKRFLSKFPNISALISSRLYFFKNHLFEVNDPSFNFWLVYAFSNQQVRTYLSSKNVSDSDINNVLSLLINNNRDLIISVPRYLELLPKYLSERGISDLSKLNRTDLFEYFIFNKLDIEEERSGTRGKEIVKRVLEMLALTMEMYQTNVLSKEDLTTFLDEISSGLSQFWHKIPLNVFYDNSLLKDNGDTVEFENTEFQEYLAAKHISRLNKPLQVTFDLAIDKDIEEVKPSWFSTLGFLSEIDQNFLKPLLDFGERNKDKLVIDERFFQLLTRFNVDQLTPDKKAEIFEFVFEYYQRVMHWIDWSVGKNLSFYYADSQHDILKEYAELPTNSFIHEDQRCVQLANVCQILGYLIRHDKLSADQISYWKDKLIGYANETGGSGVLQRHAMFALEAYKDPGLIPQLTNPWNHRESLVRREFIEFCIETDPNNTSAIDCFVSAIITKEHEGYKGINQITELNALTYLLNKFLVNEEFLEAYLDRDEGTFSTKSTTLLENIGNVWNDQISELSKQLVLKSFENNTTWYRADSSNLIIGLAKLLQQNNNTYLLQLTESIKESELLSKHIFNFRNVFASLLSLDNIEVINQSLSQNEDTKRFLYRVLQEVKYSTREDANSLYEAGRQYYADQYSEAEHQSNQESQQQMRAKTVYEDFKFKLQPEENKYMPDVFSLYNRHHNEIEALVNEQDKSRLSELLTGSIFSKFDPGEHGVQDSNNHQTHTMHSWISIFGDSIQTANLIGLDITDYRDRVVNYIPFAFEQSELEAIFSLVGQLSTSDVDRIVSRYRDRTDDTWRYHPSAFLQTIKKYRLTNAIPVLKEFVSEPELSIYDRIEALKAISIITQDKEYIRVISETYKNTDDNELAEEANGILISDYQDQSAIVWRIEELKSRAFTFVRPEGAHSMGGKEIELDMKKFAGPLYSVEDGKYENSFFSLLEKSFALIAQDKDYLAYASYLWELVYKYFENRKSEGNYKPLDNLEAFLSNFQGKEGVNWFMGKLKDLKRIYLEHVGKPPTYSACIQQYNQIKNSNYIKINNDQDLFQEIISVLENEVAKFLNGEGKQCLDSGETEVQKQLKTEIENAFLRRSFRPTDIRQDYLVWREAQDISDKKCDFVISYGFLGPILIELKLTTHGDMAKQVRSLKNRKSFKTLQQYISSFRPKHSIFLVLENKVRTTSEMTWLKHFANIKTAYESIESVKAVGLPIPS